MNAAVAPAIIATSDRALAARLRRAGLVLVVADPARDRLVTPAAPDDWLAEVVARSPMAEGALARSGAAETTSISELAPGLWLAMGGGDGRPTEMRTAGVIIPTTDFLEAEALDGMCSGAGVDATLFRRRLAELAPPPPTEVSRVARLAAICIADAGRVVHGRGVQEYLGEQLASSYEELSLLYTITQNMTIVDRPERFIDLVCRELHATLPYAWVGLVFANEPARLKQLSGQCIAVGDSAVTLREIRTRARRLWDDTHEPRVLEPRRNPDHGEFAALGSTVLVQPVTSEGKRIGLFIAGAGPRDEVVATSGDLKLLEATASHTAIFLENAGRYEDLNAMFMGTLESLTTAIDAKDRYTCGHSRRVALLTEQLARAVGLDAAAASRTRIAGLVHDVGKIGVPERVLLKPGPLDAEELDWIRRHPEMSYNILKDIPRLDDLLPGVLFHHERWDGSGYPAGLEGQDIPFIGRLIALADSFDAMSSDRTYRAKLPRHEVLAEIEREAGRQFDPDLAPVFMGLDFSEYDRMVARDRAAA